MNQVTRSFMGRFTCAIQMDFGYAHDLISVLERKAGRMLLIVSQLALM